MKSLWAAFLLLFSTTICAQIPPDAERWRRDLTRNARLAWGLEAPISTLAAQIQQESNFRPDAVSSAGALGIAQFMPKTGTWLAGVYTALGPSDPLNPQWALRAHATYTKYLWDHSDADTACDHGAKMLASYNSGEGWLHKDENLCRSEQVCVPQPQPEESGGMTEAFRWVWRHSFGADPPPEPPPQRYCGCNDGLWWGNVERMSSPGRSQANWNESRNYATRILRILEPRYVTANWGAGVCSKP